MIKGYMSKTTADDFNAIIARELPWASDIGMSCIDMNLGKAVLVIKFKENMLRPGGTISGPTMMALADATMYAVVLSAIGIVKLAVTTNFNINFLSRPRAGDMKANGSLLKLGKRLIVIETKIFSAGQDAPVAHATGTYSVPPVVAR